MRVHSRLVLGLCGLAMAVPAATRVVAAPFDDATAASIQPAPAPAPHEHKGLFGWRHCVVCQRAYVKTHDGVDVPPPPGYPGAAGMPVQGGTIVTGPMIVNGMPVQGGTVVTGPMIVNDPRGAGYAVVGPGGVDETAGYAVVGGSAPGAEPTPIGMARATQNSWADPRMAALAARPGARPNDPSVVPTGLPQAQVALSGPGHDRPHVISHLFGIPKFGRHRREREEQTRDQHAAIAYGEVNQKVTEVPASLVYGKK